MSFRTLVLSAVAAGVMLASAGVRGEESASRPHIVVLVADDLGWQDVGYHGSEIRTPHLDRLAGAGVRLEQFYVQPVCSPTRAALMTGRYPIRHGLQVGVIRPWADYGLPLDEELLPQSLARAGYRTLMIGKWHLGAHAPEYLPTSRGFAHHYGHYLGAIDYFTHRRDGGLDWHRNRQPVEEEGYSTTLKGSEAVRLIEAHAPTTPLFLYVAFNAPHSPLQAPAEYLDQYSSIANRQRRSFAAMVACLDDQVGRIAAALEQRGMTDNTLVFFCSDNGGPINLGANNGPLRGAKGSLYEGGVRVPAFVTWPRRLPAGKVVDQPLHIVDLRPTLLPLAGATHESPHTMDGRNAWATIAEGAASPHDDILLNVNPSGGAVRRGPWKLVQAFGMRRNPNTRVAPTYELFNLTDDLGEQQNLAAKHPEMVRELSARLAEYAAAAKPPQGSGGQPAGFTAPKVWGHFP